MKIVKTIIYFLLNLSLCTSSSFATLSIDTPFCQEQERSDYIQSLASLIFHLEEWKISIKDNDFFDEKKIVFSDEEVDLLWKKIDHSLSVCEEFNYLVQRKAYYEQAYQDYYQTKVLIAQGLDHEALSLIRLTSKKLQKLWQEALASEENFSFDALSFTLRAKVDPNFENNHYIPAAARKKMAPYLLPLKHPMRAFLDNLCLHKRMTTDSHTFEKAGFKTLDKRPRSYILVARHAKMPGYLVKAYLDTELREKQKKPSWEWLAQRCEGAEKVRKIIREKQFKHFVVSKKWIYCFPAHPTPPEDSKHTHHLALLLVTDMELVSKDENLHAWSHLITKEHLNELYVIISRAKGSSYRADNIAYTAHGQFAFIDTEYPSSKPDFRRIRHYLNREMRAYWDQIVKKGGP